MHVAALREGGPLARARRWIEWIDRVLSGSTNDDGTRVRASDEERPLVSRVDNQGKTAGPFGVARPNDDGSVRESPTDALRLSAERGCVVDELEVTAPSEADGSPLPREVGPASSEHDAPVLLPNFDHRDAPRAMALDEFSTSLWLDETWSGLRAEDRGETVAIAWRGLDSSVDTLRIVEVRCALGELGAEPVLSVVDERADHARGEKVLASDALRIVVALGIRRGDRFESRAHVAAR